MGFVLRLSVISSEKNSLKEIYLCLKCSILAKILGEKMNKGSLFKELFTNIKTTGAITFSSKSLVNKMLSFADFSGAKTIVELGGGDGSITRGIVEIGRASCRERVGI